MLEIEAVFIVSLKIIFMYGSMQEGHILFPFRKLLETIVSKFPVNWQFYLSKPLYDCLFCMSSVWGLLFIYIPMPLWINIILSVAGLNYLWSALIGFLHAKTEASEKESVP